jgi:hypothetical protein
MLNKLLITICLLLFGAAVPVLEINATHVFDPRWPPHARLHEVWQLATNSMIAAYCLWLTWWRGEVRLPALLTLLVTGGFFVAYLLRDGYGGSMVLSDGSEKLVFDVSIGVVGFGLAVALASLVLWRTRAEA